MATVKQLIIFSVVLSVKASSDVYKLVNSSVQLDTQDKTDQFDLFKWMFKGDIILRYLGESKFIKKLDAYKDRVEFNTETLSLTLKNLQKTDSGLYEARAESGQEKVVARYTLYVLDPVKKPELFSIYQQSRDSCNVTCLGLTLSITSSFDKKTCNESETLTDGVSFTLSFCVNGSHIICNHSHPVSSKVFSAEINQFCPFEPKSITSSDVYKLVNSEVQLDTQIENFQFDYFRWMFKRDDILIYFSGSKIIIKYEGYKDRVEFNTETQSLTLKNLQKTDSGLYEAKAESNKVKTVARYTLHVLDPVKEPELTPVSQQSSDSCNVTCLGLTHSINSSFDKRTCEESETLTEGVSYTLSLCVNGSHVICNHSNPVSSKVFSAEIIQLCPREPESITSSDVYKLVNSSVQLDTQDKIDQFEQFRWIFKSDNILRYFSGSKSITKYEAYKDRVELNTETLRLTLKNLQKTDSGLYKARAESNKIKDVARYTLHVLDPVKEPELTSVYQQSSDSCNVTSLGLTLSINSSFDKKTCEESDAITTTCGSVCLLKIVLYSVGLVLMMSAVITVHIRERLIKPEIEQHRE
ncbi:uncharacterized protein LOC134302220 [Trichomycterus rosablanca]|uniref:uncharacterized protein LOC134302220 n=1 Tax=Trichomycterus rosablanca TaxID=2290929 RepID=UPI002F35EC2E